MGFEEFLRMHEMTQRMKAARESARTTKETELCNGAPRAWHELQLAVRMTAEGKRYKGELFVWRAQSSYPASLVLKNVAATFAEREWDSLTYTVLLSGIPGFHALGALYSPDPEFIDVRFLGPNRWLVGARTEPLPTLGDDSASETICKALVTYFDDHHQMHRERGWVMEALARPDGQGHPKRRTSANKLDPAGA